MSLCPCKLRSMPPTHPSQADVAAAYRTLIAHETAPKEQDFYRDRLQRLEPTTEPECELDCRNRVAAAGVGVYCPKCSAKCADTDLTAQLAKAIRAAWVDRLDWDELAHAALKFLTSTGRLIPAGGHVLTAEEWANRITLADKQVAVSEAWEQGFEYGSGHKYGAEDDGVRLTAEQVEDVKIVLGQLERGGPAFEAAHERLRTLFPATEPVEVRGNICTERNSSTPVDEGRESGGQMDRYTCIPAPAEPAEEETKAERGPEWFREIADAVDEIEKIPGMYHSMTLRSWAGVFRNHADTLELASSPVIPAPAETGPWQTWQEVPEGVWFLTNQNIGCWMRRDGDKVTTVTGGWPVCTDSLVAQAPFVAAEEGRA